jgi:MarR family 2-MHQ and catechol resistance regulon transcriptional repressor
MQENPMMALQHELKKRTPFASPRQEAMLNVWRTGDLAQNRFGKLLRKYGVTASQYNILRILRGNDRPLPCLEIASQMIQAVPAITRLIDQLDQAGLITRERSADDRRVVFVEITAKGRKVVKELDGPVEKLHDDLLSALTIAETKELSRLLEKVRAGWG